MVLVLVLVSKRDYMIAYFFESLIDALPIQMGCELIILNSSHGNQTLIANKKHQTSKT